MQSTSTPRPSAARRIPRIPAWLKWAYTGFLLVLVPVYWRHYGPANFLYFCDMALFLTLAAIWLESSLPASMAAVGILLPQIFWCLDFASELLGVHLTGMTGYMFEAQRPLFLRSLSLFHGWLPFLLLFLVKRLGYDQRALKAWSGLAAILCLVAFFLLPPAGAALANPSFPRNVNYVFGLNDAHPQTWMPQGVYLVAWMLTLFGVAYLPTHWVLGRVAPCLRPKVDASRRVSAAAPSGTFAPPRQSAGH